MFGHGSRTKHRSAPTLGVALALGILLSATLSACGGASSSSSSASSASAAQTSSASTSPSESGSSASGGEVVVKFGATPITSAQVNHWMAVLAGQTYYGLSSAGTEPVGLVSDPPDYGACVHRLEVAIATSPTAKKGADQSAGRLLTKCRQLNQKVRGQAVTFLIQMQIVNSLAAEQGVGASEAEVLSSYATSSRERFHSAAEQAAFLAARRTGRADELAIARRDLLSRKALAKLKASGKGLTDVARLEAALKAKTDCSPGYVVEQCSQFKGEAPVSVANPTGSIVTEQIVALITGRCTNLQACGKE
jgi:hypothetical protein